MTVTINGATVEEVDFCDCTNEQLEAGRHCQQPTCPNRPTKKRTRLQQYRDFIESELDAGRGMPTNRQIAAAMDRDNKSTQLYGLGGRYTYEKQKIKIERGIATHEDIEAFNSKDGTYGDISEAGLQRAVVQELKDRGEFFR